MAGKDEGRIGADGTIEWRDRDGELHRVGAPAVIHANGSVNGIAEGQKINA